jgi:hypothetical protein
VQLVPTRRQLAGQFVTYIDSATVLAEQCRRSRKRSGPAVDARSDRRRQSSRAAALGQACQLAAPIGICAGVDIEQREYSGHDVCIDVNRLASFVAVEGGHSMGLGQLAQVLGYRFGCRHQRVRDGVTAGRICE